MKSLKMLLLYNLFPQRKEHNALPDSISKEFVKISIVSVQQKRYVFRFHGPPLPFVSTESTENKNQNGTNM